MSMSAMVVGSMIPDFQYFIQMKLSGRFSHTFEGVFLFDLPIAFLVLVVFHALVKDQLIDNLPLYFSKRLQRLKMFSFFRYGKEYPAGLVLCILIGTVSHIFWDSFTHVNGMFVELFPKLTDVINSDMLPVLPIYRYLQHISTILGAVLILYTFHRMPGEEIRTKPNFRFWVIVTIFFMVAFLIRTYFGIGYYGDLITILISAGLLGIILASAVMRIRWNKT